MIFSDTKPIYIQISDLILDKIMDQAWVEDSRIPSVREMGGELEVNPNTVMRAYEWLSERGIIYNKRGIGFFVSADALRIITDQRRAQLISVGLKDIARQMKQLDVTVDEVMQHLNNHLKML
ncbi:MAG: GntR family transcriptional regulator [Rikenellaceae bacterium]